MGSLSKLIKEKGGELGGGKTEQVRVQQIHYTKLKESDLNFYTRSEDDVIELADTMLIAGGILQPLIVRKTDLSEYEILAGHKRKRASVYNVERGYKEFEFLPCIVIDMSGLMAKKISEKILAGQGEIEDDKLLDMIAEYIVICTNSTASESSHYEKMMQAVRLSKILPTMLENEELKGRALRVEIAKEMKCGNGQIGRYQSIYNNLIPEAMERFKNGSLTVTLASEMAGLDGSMQKEALIKQEITAADIEILKKKWSRETVSESDTEKASDPKPLYHEENNETVSKLDTEKIQPVSESVAGVNGDIEKTTATSKEVETIQAHSTGYSWEEVKKLYDEQTEIIGQFIHVVECGEMTDKEVRMYKTAQMIRDGMEYLLDIKEEQNRIPVPCKIGDTVYSTVGEKVNTYIVTGFRIDREKTYMETEDSTFLPADRIGVNYFFSREHAEKEFDKKWGIKH